MSNAEEDNKTATKAMPAATGDGPGSERSNPDREGQAEGSGPLVQLRKIMARFALLWHRGGKVADADADDVVPEETPSTQGFPARFLSHFSRWIPRSRRDLTWTLLGTLLALGVGLAVSGVIALPAAQEETPQEDASGAGTAERSTDDVKKDLDPVELLKLAEGAVLEGDLDRAMSFAEDGLARTDAVDDSVRSRFFRLLSEISNKRGEFLKSRIYLQNASRLLARSGQVLTLLEQARRAYADKQFSKARQLCAAFLLRQGELPAKDREVLEPSTSLLLGKSSFAEWALGVSGRLEIVARPTFGFQGDL